MMKFRKLNLTLFFIFTFSTYPQEIIVHAKGVDIFGTLPVQENKDIETLYIIVHDSVPVDIDGTM